jgi:hypothetical protein
MSLTPRKTDARPDHAPPKSSVKTGEKHDSLAKHGPLWPKKEYELRDIGGFPAEIRSPDQVCHRSGFYASFCRIILPAETPGHGARRKTFFCWNTD